MAYLSVYVWGRVLLVPDLSCSQPASHELTDAPPETV